MLQEQRRGDLRSVRPRCTPSVNRIHIHTKCRDGQMNKDRETYTRRSAFSFASSSFFACLAWFSFLLTKKKKFCGRSVVFPCVVGQGTTDSRMSFGFSKRLTVANLRVFFAFPYHLSVSTFPPTPSILLTSNEP